MLVPKLHLVEKRRDDGELSPLCAKKPRKLNRKNEGWVGDGGITNCKKCKQIYEAKQRQKENDLPPIC